MKIVRLGVALLALAAAGPASAQLLIAPPIVAKEVAAPSDTVQRAILEELIAAGIKPVEQTTKILAALEKCKNKMSCLATAGKAAGASHVLHTIMAERDGQVLAQLTLVAVNSKKAIEPARAKTGPEFAAIERGVRSLIGTVVASLMAQPDFPKPTVPPPVAPPVAVNTPPVSPPPPDPKPSPAPYANNTPPPPRDAPPALRDLPAGYTPTGPYGATVVKKEAPPKTGPNYAAFTVGGVGLAAAATGIVFLALASGDASSRDQTPQVFVDDRKRLDDSAHSKQSIGIALLAGGGGAVVVGAFLWALDIGATSSDTAMVAAAKDGFLVHF